MKLSIGGVNIYDIRYLSDWLADVHPLHHQSCQVRLETNPPGGSGRLDGALDL